REFEQQFLSLVFRTSARITPHVVAYRLGIPFAEANEHLDRLAKQGMITLEIDEAGPTYYQVPGVDRPAQGVGSSVAQPAVQKAMPYVAPAPRTVTAPRGPSGLSVAGMILGGIFLLPVAFALLGLLKFFFFPLFFLLLFGGLWGRGHRRGCYRGWGGY